VIGEAILHPADMPMVLIEDARVSPCPAIVDNDKLPTTPLHRARGGSLDHRSPSDNGGARTALTTPKPCAVAVMAAVQDLDLPRNLISRELALAFAGTARGILTGDDAGVGAQPRAVAAGLGFRGNGRFF
jgi:hypothetical protein